jgi:hypothetical protein
VPSVRPLTELIETQDPAWPQIEAAVATGSCPVVVLPADAKRADEELFRLQATTRSWLGAVIHHTGGLVLDHGWLRVLGSGNTEHHLASLSQLSESTLGGGILVAQDVLGGQFAWVLLRAARRRSTISRPTRCVGRIANRATVTGLPP